MGSWMIFWTRPSDGFVLLAQMLAQDFRDGVHHKGHQKQNHRAQKQRAVERAVQRGFGQFDRDVGRQRAHAGKNVEIHHGRIAGGHDDNHGFAHRATQPDHHRGKNSGRGRRQHHAHGRLPSAGAQRQGTRTQGARNVGNRVFADGENDGNDREAHHETDDERIALLEFRAREVRPPKPEVRHFFRAIAHDEEQSFKRRPKLPRAVNDHEEDGQEHDEFVAGPDKVAIANRQPAPGRAKDKGAQRGDHHHQN